MLSQTETLQIIQEYLPQGEEEQIFHKRFQELIQKDPDFASRKRKAGHLTASAWILNIEENEVLLLHHQKLDRWLQPGGHIEEEDDSLLAAAQRELEEETGIKRYHLASPGIFDLDIHWIPARGDMPKHEHFDVRFLFKVSAHTPLLKNEESKALAWFEAKKVREMHSESSIVRMLAKSLA